MAPCRTPQGVRGLKSDDPHAAPPAHGSHPARGAWIEIGWKLPAQQGTSSHPARGAWIEIFWLASRCLSYVRRTPQGVRGLKYILQRTLPDRISRTPQGVRGLKSLGCGWAYYIPRRTPQGVRGLKSPPERRRPRGRRSHPARGAWIEMSRTA